MKTKCVKTNSHVNKERADYETKQIIKNKQDLDILINCETKFILMLEKKKKFERSLLRLNGLVWRKTFVSSLYCLLTYIKDKLCKKLRIIFFLKQII